jgi:hypothetical protein
MDVLRSKSINGWLSAREDDMLSDVYRSVDIAKAGSKRKRMAAFL